MPMETGLPKQAQQLVLGDVLPVMAADGGLEVLKVEKVNAVGPVVYVAFEGGRSWVWNVADPVKVFNDR